MRYEVVGKKGLILRESEDTTSAKVCEVRKGAFVYDFGRQCDVGGVQRIEVCTAEGQRGWCSHKSQLLVARESGESPAPEETASQLVIAALSEASNRDFAVEQLLFMGGERGAAGARAARGPRGRVSPLAQYVSFLVAREIERLPFPARAGLVSIASSLDGFRCQTSTQRLPDEARPMVVAVLGWSGAGLADLDRVSEMYLDKWPAADVVKYVAPVLVAAPLSLVAAGERALFEVEKALGLDDEACDTPLLFHVAGNAGLRCYARLLERARRVAGAPARLTATIFESAPAACGPSAAEMCARLDELLAELTDPDATLKRFDAYDALVADADRSARERVVDLETACMVCAHEEGMGFPSGPRQGGRLPGLPSLFLVPAGDPAVKDFLDLRKAVALRDGLQRRDSTAVLAADAGLWSDDSDGRAIFAFLAGPCGLPSVSPIHKGPRGVPALGLAAPAAARDGAAARSPRSPVADESAPSPSLAAARGGAPSFDGHPCGEEAHSVSPGARRRVLSPVAPLLSPARLSPGSLARDLPPVTPRGGRKLGAPLL